MLEAITGALEERQSDDEASQRRLDVVQGGRSWALTHPLRDLNSLAGDLRKRRKA
jgi:hypothetical protein